MLGIINKIKKYKKEIGINRSSGFPVKYYNWWQSNSHPKDFWFSKFILSRQIMQAYPDKNIAFFSCFGIRIFMSIIPADVKIFYTGENTEDSVMGFSRFNDYGLNSKDIDLALGFKYLEHPNYFRFPLYILDCIDPLLSITEQKKHIEKLSFNKENLNNRTRFCSLIAGHDLGGQRKQIYDSVNTIDAIECPGRFLHNTSALWEQFQDDKLLYLKQFKFNICPENTNRKGYVTEKIFHAIAAGCIPVYWGSENNPEPEILNQDAIIFWNESKNNESALNLIADLHHNSSQYKEFMMQKRLLPNASEYIFDTLNELEQKIRRILKNV